MSQQSLEMQMKIMAIQNLPKSVRELVKQMAMRTLRSRDRALLLEERCGIFHHALMAAANLDGEVDTLPMDEIYGLLRRLNSLLLELEQASLLTRLRRAKQYRGRCDELSSELRKVLDNYISVSFTALTKMNQTLAEENYHLRAAIIKWQHDEMQAGSDDESDLEETISYAISDDQLEGADGKAESLKDDKEAIISAIDLLHEDRET